MTDKSRSSSNASLDEENNPFTESISLPNRDSAESTPTSKRKHRRRLSSLSQSHEELENLEYAHFQNQCKIGSHYTLSVIRLLGKLSEGYDRFARTLNSSVDLESNFVSKYTTKFNKESKYLSCFDLLCHFTKDLATDFQSIATKINEMTSPLMEFQRQCDAKYNTIYKKHEQCYNKYKSDESHLNSYAEKYKTIITEERNKFKLIQLLSSGIMPPHDHKTLKKSWHSPSKLNQSVSKLLKKAQSQTRKVSFLNKSKSSAAIISNYSSDPESKNESANEEQKNNIDDVYEYNTHLEIERMAEDKEEHIPLLYAMYKYSNGRNKLLKQEDKYVNQISNVNHSMTQYEYIRKETMKAMKKMEIDRLGRNKDIYSTLVSVLKDDQYQIIKKQSFSKFIESTQELEATDEFNRFLRTSQEFNMRYVRPKAMVSSDLLLNWRTSYHLLEDLMFIQTNSEHINKNTLRVPFIFEYLMEHIEDQQGINDPDIFMVNPMSPNDSHIDHAFKFTSSQSPHYKNDNNDPNQELTMKTTDLLAIPVLTRQIDELYACQHVSIADHHHAIILLKLWFHKSPEPIIPYYLYKTVCEFQEMDTVQQRRQFVKHEILSHLSSVRLHCLARLVSICKKIVKVQNEITIIDLSYELSNVIIRNPAIKQWRQLDPVNNAKQDNLDDMHQWQVMLDPQTTYKLPLSPSHREKRAEMAFITYILSNEVEDLSEKKVVNYGQKLKQYQAQHNVMDNNDEDQNENEKQ